MLPTDQEGYEIALKNYLSREKPEASNLKIVELDIPVATGFSNAVSYTHLTLPTKA